MKCDCTGEPPGELMSSATARALRTENARSSWRAIDASMRPGRRGLDTPMTPASRTTGTIGISLRSRRGVSGRSSSRALANSCLRCSDLPWSAMISTHSPDRSHVIVILSHRRVNCRALNWPLWARVCHCGMLLALDGANDGATKQPSAAGLRAMDPFKIYLLLALIGLIAAAAYWRRQPPQPT